LPNLVLLLSVTPHLPSGPPATGSLPVTIPTACTAVTRGEIEKALGHPLELGREERDGNQSSCDYRGGGGQVTITILRSRRRLDVPSEIAALRAALPQAEIRDTREFGMRAIYLDLPGMGTQLHIIRSGRDYIMVSILGFGEARQVAPPAAKIARAILDRI
jgi:hypothetical protein